MKMTTLTGLFRPRASMFAVVAALATACGVSDPDGGGTTGGSGGSVAGSGGSAAGGRGGGTGGSSAAGSGGSSTTGGTSGGGSGGSGTGGSSTAGSGGGGGSSTTGGSGGSSGSGGSEGGDAAAPPVDSPSTPPIGGNGMPVCDTAPAATPPALRRGTTITGFAGQAGQVVGVPGENTLYVVGHRNGNMYVVVDGKVSGTFFHVDISTGAGNEQGLLSMALHPSFATNKLFYVFYTAPNGNITIDEYERLTPTTCTKKGNLYNQPRLGGGAFHNGGSIYFNPKDASPLLYLAVGNHGSRGQSSMPNGGAGRILQFDLGTKASKTIAYGLRNPYRMSIDRLTGDMWIGEVSDGPGGSVIFLGNGKSGVNFGYGTGGTSGGISGQQPGSAALIGGVVYRGKKINGLCGRYFYGMHAGGGVRSIIQENGMRMGGITNHPELTVPGNISSFGEDGEGEIWMSSMNGNAIYKIEAAN
jgi:hypothetical protein